MSFKDHFQVSDTMPLESEQQPNKKVWVNFLPNIDLGHLLTMIGFGVAFAAQWNIQDRRITTIEAQQKHAEVAQADVKSDIKEIKAVVLNIQLQQAALNAARAAAQVK